MYHRCPRNIWPGDEYTLEKRDPCKVLSLVFKIMKVLLYAIVNMLSVWSVVWSAVNATWCNCRRMTGMGISLVPFLSRGCSSRSNFFVTSFGSVFMHSFVDFHYELADHNQMRGSKLIGCKHMPHPRSRHIETFLRPLLSVLFNTNAHCTHSKCKWMVSVHFLHVKHN